ncbi:MAG: NepR family anti-sigma factor [Croceibacterium sp.]
MAGAAKIGKPARRGPVRGKPGEAPWTSGLKHLYDSVVEEPIPDAFRELLAKLDDSKP